MDFSVLANVNLLQLLLYLSFTPPIAAVISSPHMGEVCPGMITKDPSTTILWLEGSSSPSKESRYSWLWISDSYTALYPLQRVEKERRVNKACDKLLLSVINVEIEMQGTCSFSLCKYENSEI